MENIEEEVLRKLLIDLFLATPRKRAHLLQNSQESMHVETKATTYQIRDNQQGENHDEKEAKT